MDKNVPYIIGFIFGLILVSAVASLIGAFFVQISTRIVAGFKPTYGRAWLTAFAVMIASSVIRFALTAIIGVPTDVATQILLMVGLCCVQATISGEMLEHPETGAIGFGKGLLVTLVQWVIGVVSLVLLILALFLCLPKDTAKSLSDPATYRNLQLKSAFHAQTTRIAHHQTALASPSPSPSVVKAVDVVQKVQESQREAVRLYPELGVAGSKFNREFIARHARYKKERPGYFLDPTWPVSLAQETQDALNPK